jgi:hypothetical protein
MKRWMMNNYTIDVSIFLLNEDEFNNVKEKEQRKLVMGVCRDIYAYENLRFSLDNSVFFSKYDTNEFLKKIENIIAFWKEHKDKIKKLLADSGYGYDFCKKTLKDVWNSYQQKKDNYQPDWRQSFNQQFRIKICPNDVQLVKDPDKKILEIYGENFKSMLASIALLNQYIYHPDYNKHLFLYKGLTEFGDELTIISFIKDICIEDVELRKIIKNPDKLEGVVKKKSLKKIVKEDRRFETLEKAVKQAKNDFSENLLFGNDVDSGVKGRSKDAGPPDKVYYYLKTLSEVTEIKRTEHPDWCLVLLTRMYGCNCSSESDGVQKNENCMRKRTWHDGTGYSRFIDHLKPSEGERLPGGIWDNFCIRIYFEWDEETQKTIVGWIGEHP